MANVVFELLAKLGLDRKEFDQGMDNAEQKTSTFGSKLKSGLGAAAKVGAAAVAAVGTAAVAMGKQALDAYADYEQLEGGIQTLYGENTEASKKMMEQASEAWKTAGMSANDYMETAIQSSAALISSLEGDVDKAAELMDMSIVDMSDNVNKMGTTMESVQNAYRGFSRGNFTMLDNLALGYAGTKEGMQQLLDKAKELEAQQGRNRDFSIDSYADIVEAIHIVQDSMGIAGTTAKEANETISGSVNAMKAAWSNLLVGIADDNANITELVNQFVDSLITVGDNIIPRIQTILNGATQVITAAAEKLIPVVVQVIIDNLPMLAKSAMSLIDTITKTIIQNLPKLVDSATEIILSIVDGIIEALPELIPAVVEVITTLVTKLTEPSTLTRLIQAAFDIMGALAKGIIQAIPTVVAAIPQVISNLLNTIRGFFTQIDASGVELIGQLAMGILSGVGQVVGAVISMGSEIASTFGEIAIAAWNWGVDLIGNFISGIVAKAGELWETLKGIGRGVRDFIGFSEPKKGPLSDFHTYAPDMMELFAKGIRDNEDMLKDTVASAFDFGSMTVKSSPDTSASGGGFEWDGLPIVVQCVLDGRIISENTTKWQRRMARATG